jgi:hypothetical protein
MQITVPICYLPNSKAQVFDMDTCKRSAFQVNTLLQISQREDFAYFVVCLDGGANSIMFPEFKGPALVIWYDKDGSMHSISLGVKRILRTIDSPQGTPVPLDHVVYTSRCL